MLQHCGSSPCIKATSSVAACWRVSGGIVRIAEQRMRQFVQQLCRSFLSGMLSSGALYSVGKATLWQQLQICSLPNIRAAAAGAAGMPCKQQQCWGKAAESKWYDHGQAKRRQQCDEANGDMGSRVARHAVASLASLDPETTNAVGDTCAAKRLCVDVRCWMYEWTSSNSALQLGTGNSHALV